MGYYLESTAFGNEKCRSKRVLTENLMLIEKHTNQVCKKAAACICISESTFVQRIYSRRNLYNKFFGFLEIMSSDLGSVSNEMAVYFSFYVWNL